MLSQTYSRVLLTLFVVLIAVASWWLLRDPLSSPNEASLQLTRHPTIEVEGLAAEPNIVSSRTSAIVEIEAAPATAAEPEPEAPAADPAPSYPFDPHAPVPHLKLNVEAMQSPALLMNLLRTNTFVNPGGLPFTEQEAKKLLEGARAEIALTRQTQKQFLDEKSAAVHRAVKNYDGPRFKSFDQAATYARSAYQGTRLGSVIIKELQGEQVSMAIMLDAEKELATYLLYKEMLDVADVAAARLRQLIETGAYR